MSMQDEYVVHPDLSQKMCVRKRTYLATNLAAEIYTSMTCSPAESKVESNEEPHTTTCINVKNAMTKGASRANAPMCHNIAMTM